VHYGPAVLTRYSATPLLLRREALLRTVAHKGIEPFLPG
jgi:hypothetical protein